MPRIRTLKPEFWTDEKLAALPPVVRLVFLGLISLADDFGRVHDNVKAIDAALFCDTDDTASESLQTLERLGRIRRGLARNGKPILEIVNWAKHQRVDKPQERTALPPIAEANREPFANHSGTIRESFANDSRTIRPIIATESASDDEQPPSDEIATECAEESEPPALSQATNSLEKPTSEPIRDAFANHSGTIRESFANDSRTIRPIGAPGPTTRDQRPGTEERERDRETAEGSEPSALVPLMQDPRFRDVWKRWELHRNSKCKPIGPIEAEQQLMKLGSYDPSEAIAIVQFSIERGALNLIFDGGHRRVHTATEGRPRRTGADAVRELLSKGKGIAS